MDRYKIEYRQGNQYFDTYKVRDTQEGKFVGIIEDHCRGVIKRYFVGWYFNGHMTGFPNESGKTKSCDTQEEALDFVINGQ